MSGFASSESKPQSNIYDVARVSVLLDFCLFHGLFLCFCCWFCAGNCRHAPFASIFVLNGVNSNDNDNNNNNNWLVDWILLPQLHKRSVEPWKLCLILSSFELLRSSLRILGRLIPNGF